MEKTKKNQKSLKIVMIKLGTLEAGVPQVIDNIKQAKVWLNYLKKQFRKNPFLLEKCIDIVTSYIKQVHVLLVPSNQLSTVGSYFAHQPVLHP